MKTTLALLAMLSFNAFAMNDLTINVNQQSRGTIINVQTGMRSSMCSMEVTELKLTKPETTFSGETITPGRIEVTFQTNPRSICMMATGPHRGTLTLESGQSGLPLLKHGDTYVLAVEGAEEQTFTIK